MPRVDSRQRSEGRTPAKPPPALHARRPSRMGLFWRRRNRMVWPALGMAVLLGLVLAGASVVHSFRPGNTIATLPERLGFGSGLVVKDIRIEGRDKTPENFLRAALGINKGDKLLAFSLDAARARIEKLTWVQHATVERHLPGTIVVRLEERRPFAVWQNNGKFQLIDRTGEVVVAQDPAKDADAFKTLPLVVGAGAPEAAATLLDDLATLPSLRSRVVAAVRVGERRWNLHLSNGADVLLPEGAEGPAMTKLMELQASEALLDRPLQVVDMRLPDRLVVRPTAAAAAPAGQGGKKPS
ncbi:MAG: FtsQ-type POTRA domain-containing protein [Acetobacteraceae bacterium]|nr:FtsQ-type POTRA domain-containing protein [Acetobacteraceae bacterium]